MAALVTPTPGAIAAALYAVRTARLETPRPILDLFRSVLRDIDELEAQMLPQTLGRLLGLFAADPIRRSALLDTIATFDMFEALPDIRRLLEEYLSPEALVTAAKLAANPGVRPDDREWISGLIRDRSIDSNLRRMLEIVSDPDAQPFGVLENAAHSERWPGAEDAHPDQVAPIVALDESGAPALEKWSVAASLHESGATVRRVPADWSARPSSFWLSPAVLVLSWDAASFSRLVSTYPAMSASQLRQLPRTAYAHNTAVRYSAEFYGQDRIVAPRIATGLTDLSPIDPDAYHLGSFDSHEVAVLTGTRRNDLYANLHNVLPPSQRKGHDVYWSFSQVVALRTWQYFRSQAGGRRPSLDLLTALESFAGAKNPTAVGVTADGQVLRRQDDYWVNVASDQIYIEQVRSLDAVFQPFELGGYAGASEGRSNVPALLGPTDHSKVHPALLGGSPAVIGTRLPVRALAEYERDQGAGSAHRAYGLEVAVANDVLPLGHRLLAA